MTHPLRSNPSQSSHTGDFFHGTPTAWTDSPLEAFDVWMDDKGFAGTSRAVYRSLWTGYVNWLKEKGIGLDKVDSFTLKTYLSGLDVKLQQRERRHRIIERAYQEITASHSGGFNPATLASVRRKEDWRAADSNDETEFLDGSAYQDAIVWIENKQLPKGERRATAPRADSRRAPAVWRHQRDRAICAIALGGGLKVAEICSLSVKDVKRLDGGARISVWIRRDNIEPRTVELEPFAARCVSAWLAVHQQTVAKAAELGAEALFPIAAAGEPLSVRSIHRAVTGFFLGTDAHEGPFSPQLLRNAYAALLFERGTPLEAVGQVLGYRQDLSIKRLHDFWQLWKGEPGTTNSSP